MVPAQKSGLTLSILPGEFDAAARADYGALLAPKVDTADGLSDLDERLTGAEFFDVVIDGDLVGRYAVRVWDRPHGKEASVIAAVGKSKAFRLVNLLPIIEAQQLANADFVRIETKRNGLIAQLMAQGYRQSSVILRKRISKGNHGLG